MDDCVILHACQGMNYNTSLRQQKKIHKRAKACLAKGVRSYRRAVGLSQEELALRIGLDQAYISRIESERLNPTLETIAELAAAMGISIEELLS